DAIQHARTRRAGEVHLRAITILGHGDLAAGRILLDQADLAVADLVAQLGDATIHVGDTVIDRGQRVTDIGHRLAAHVVGRTAHRTVRVDLRTAAQRIGGSLLRVVQLAAGYRVLRVLGNRAIGHTSDHTLALGARQVD